MKRAISRFVVAAICGVAIGTSSANAFQRVPDLGDRFGAAVQEAVPPAPVIDEKADSPTPEKDPTRPTLEEAPPPAEPAVKEGHYEIELFDGSLLQGELLVKEIDVVTKYGPLKIPLTELQSITTGLSTQTALQEQIKRLVEELGSDDFKQREVAQVELAGMGSKIREILQAALPTDDAERARRLRVLLDGIAEQERTWGVEGEKPLPPADVVTTTQFAASGQVQAKSLKMKGVFGEVEVKLEHIVAVRRASGPRSRDAFAATKVGSEHLMNVKAFDSKIRVRRGDTVAIRAGGTIKRGGSYMFRPEGNSSHGQFSSGGVSQRVSLGALMVQVGSDGEAKLAGSRSTFVAEEDGVLHFSIALSPEYASAGLDGNYEVKVRVTSAK